jgi:hypothetical protein
MAVPTELPHNPVGLQVLFVTSQYSPCLHLGPPTPHKHAPPAKISAPSTQAPGADRMHVVAGVASHQLLAAHKAPLQIHRAVFSVAPVLVHVAIAVPV